MAGDFEITKLFSQLGFFYRNAKSELQKIYQEFLYCTRSKQLARDEKQSNEMKKKPYLGR